MKKNALLRLLAGILTACCLCGSMSVLPLTAGATPAAEPPKAQTANLDNIVITVFWPPNPNQLNLEEQVQLMADAGITEIFGAGNGCDTPEIQAQFLELAEKYGMTMIVSDGSFDKAVLNLTEEEIMANVAKYADNPVVTGFHLQDEPQNANIFIDAYTAIRKAAPHLDGHINFIHMTAVGGPDGYNRKMGDWLSLTNRVSENPTWLMYDYYPFENNKPFDYSLYLLQLDTVRKLGLRNEVPTAYYLQATGVEGQGQWYLPREAENRYEVYSALAYGFKKFSYFLWSYPDSNGSLVSFAGVPSELYYNAARVNKEALALGSILAKCDAIDVYMTQTQYDHTELLPTEYILSIPEGKNADMILSRLVHQETGRNYLMLVNNDMTAEHSLTFTMDEEITTLEVVSKTDGTLSPYEGENGTYTVTLAAGDGILLALPEDYICPVDMERANASLEGVNLATTAKFTASSSTGQDGWYVWNMTDGITHPKLQRDDAMGWQSRNEANPVLTLDFGEPIALSNVNLYAAGGKVGGKFGTYMPVDTVISVSTDGRTWTDVTTVTGYNHAKAASQGDPLSIDLGGAVGRYLRLTVTQAKADENGNPLTQIGEIEVFGTPSANKSQLGSLIKKYAYFGGDTGAALYETAMAAMQDETSRQGYVDFLTKQMTAPVAELEANFVEPPTEKDTAGTAAPTVTEGSSETVIPAEEGCASALGLSAAVLTVVMAAAVVLKKRD